MRFIVILFLALSLLTISCSHQENKTASTSPKEIAGPKDIADPQKSSNAGIPHEESPAPMVPAPTTKPESKPDAMPMMGDDVKGHMKMNDSAEYALASPKAEPPAMKPPEALEPPKMDAPEMYAPEAKPTESAPEEPMTEIAKAEEPRAEMMEETAVSEKKKEANVLEGSSLFNKDRLIKERGGSEKTGADKASEQNVDTKTITTATKKPVISKPKPKPKVWKKSGPQSNAARISIGNQEYLELKAVRVMVKIEGLRTRTIVDHLFYNPHDRQLQGTFDYRLPDQSTIGYFAFYPNLKGAADNGEVPASQNQAMPQLPTALAQAIYSLPVSTMLEKEESVFGTPKVAHVVPKQKALVAYEETVRQNIDPALMEWAGGNTFSARVFPLQPKNYQRVVIAYEEKLPNWQGQCRYSFFFPEDKGVAISFTLVSSNQYVEKGQLSLDTGAKVQGDLTVYEFVANTDTYEQDHAEYLFPASPASETILGQENEAGPTYLLARLSPQLETTATGSGSPDAIFLLDTSLSQEPDEIAISLKFIRRVLELNPEIARFNLLFFNVAASWYKNDGWQANSPQVRQQLFDQLDTILLEGATDLESALLTLTATPWLNEPQKNVDIFLLTNGQGTWGDPMVRRLMAKFQKNLQFVPKFYSYNFGLGGTNHEFFSALNQFGGTTFTCHGAAELDNIAIAHKRPVFLREQVSATDIADLLISPDASAIYPGQQLIIAGKIIGKKPGVTLTGRFQGAAKELFFALPTSQPGKLAPRAFGEMAVRKMESMDDPALEPAIIAFARYYAVPGKSCSLLMLETAEDYAKFAIDLKQDTDTVQKSVVAFLNDAAANLKNSLASAKSLFGQFWEELQTNPLVKFENPGYIAKLIPLVAKEEFELSAAPIACQLQWKDSSLSDYLASRQQDRKNPEIYLNESEKRYGQKLTGDAIRCISSLVELEPQNSIALRLTGYWLLRKQIPGIALAIFGRVRDQRPFEPQTYRDLAKCYAGIGKYGVAAVYYEIVLAGTWHERFGDLKTIVRDEYLRMLRTALKSKQTKMIKDFFGSRLEELCSDPSYKEPADIMVTMSWNTDNTDVDLWITEPTGEECGYNHQSTQLGGQLLQDITRGYGPERYRLQKAAKGIYLVKVHYYSGDRTKLSDRTFVEVCVTLRSGHPDEKSMNFLVMLTSTQEKAPIVQFNWPPTGD